MNITESVAEDLKIVPIYDPDHQSYARQYMRDHFYTNAPVPVALDMANLCPQLIEQELGDNMFEILMLAPPKGMFCSFFRPPAFYLCLPKGSYW
jgi:hypothetical protein